MSAVRLLAAATLALLCIAPAARSAQTRPTPIPSGPLSPKYTYRGSPAVASPIPGTGAIPHNRFMAANGRSEIHDDEWQSDVYTWGGPLGRRPQTFSNYLATSGTPSIGRDCGSITFSRDGRVIAICITFSGPELYMFDPKTLSTLATFPLPRRTAEDLILNPGTKIFQDFSAGGYFYLDNHDQVITSTTTQHIYVVGETPRPGFKLLHDYPLTSVLHSDEEITSQLPDSHGLLWFTARRDGVVGTLDFATGRIRVIRLGQGSNSEITKSLATDSSGGVFIPTNHKLYRFVAGPDGVPKISWQVSYPNNGVSKPGQLDAGTGTTPVIAGGGRYVGINDNENPMDVVIYRTAVRPTRVVRTSNGTRRVPAPRQVCRVAVFHKNSSADENAMIAAGRSYLIENNYGYTQPAFVGAQDSAPGLARVEINQNGTDCRLVWTNYNVQAPTVVSKMSLANGLIYTYTTNRGDTANPWYWTAVNFRTGRVVYQTLAGTGLGYNNNYSGIVLGPSGTEYVGVLGGIVALRDGAPPPNSAPPPSSGRHRHHHRTPSRVHHRHRHPSRKARRHRRSRGFTG